MLKLKSLLLGLGLAFGLSGLTAAAETYFGFNPSTGLSGERALSVAYGTVPVVTGCNTSAPTVTGGANSGKIVTAGTTACTPTLTWTIPALVANQTAPTLNGVVCYVVDMTTTAKLFTQSATAVVAPTASAAGSVSCTFTASAAIVAADVLLYNAQAF